MVQDLPEDFELWGYDLRELRFMRDFALSMGWPRGTFITVLENYHKRLHPGEVCLSKLDCPLWINGKDLLTFVENTGREYGFRLK